MTRARTTQALRDGGHGGHALKSQNTISKSVRFAEVQLTRPEALLLGDERGPDGGILESLLDLGQRWACPNAALGEAGGRRLVDFVYQTNDLFQLKKKHTVSIH